MIILGVDGGGTKTHALVVDEHGTLLGHAVGGPSGYHVIGLDQALNEIEDVAQHALDGRAADIAVFCLGDCDSSSDQQRLCDGISARKLATRVICYNDSFAALRAGSSRPYGVAVICGTGFNACGIAPDGRQARLPALGPLTGDWGGGGTLGTAIFSAVYRADDGRDRPTLLTGLLLEALHVADLSTLADWIADNRINYAQISALAPLLFEAAELGDSVAQSIIIHQADEIAVTVIAMLRKLNMMNIDVDVVLAGGVINGRGSLLIDRATSQITAQCPQVHVQRLSVPPVVGAVFLAFDTISLPTPNAGKVWSQALLGGKKQPSDILNLTKPVITKTTRLSTQSYLLNKP